MLPCPVARRASGRWSCISRRRCSQSRLWSIWGIRPGSVRMRWLHDDPWYADAVPIRTYRWRLGAARWNCACQACSRSGRQRSLVAGASALHHWMRLYRAGGMAAPETRTEGYHASGRNRSRTIGRRPGCAAPADTGAGAGGTR